MPDEIQPVNVVSVGGVVQRTVYQFCEGVWSDWNDDVNVEAFTHWMQLPTAPQEKPMITPPKKHNPSGVNVGSLLNQEVLCIKMNRN